MADGIDLAAQDNPEHAAAMDRMKEQLLIVFVNRLGGDVTIPRDEINSTGEYVMYLAQDMEAGTFRFTVEKKH